MLFLLDSNVSQPVSVRRELIETNFVAPVTFRAASFCIFSRSFDSYFVQLLHTTSAYSKRGRIKEKYIVWRDFLSSSNLSLRIIFIRFHDFDFINSRWLWQVQLLEKVTPKCL